jgi:thiol:disulfide interchange protein DsbD
MTPRELPGLEGLSWTHDLARALEQARTRRTPTLLDFYADWCLPCKELDLKTFSHPDVRRALSGHTLVKVDCTTDDDPHVAEVKTRYGAQTLPTLAILDADGHVERRIDHFVNPEELVQVLRER